MCDHEPCIVHNASPGPESVDQEIKNMSVDKELMFLHHKVAGFERPQEFKGSEYYQDFRAWLAENGFTDYKAKDAVRFGLYMKKVSGVMIDRRAANTAWYVIDPVRIPNNPN